MGSGFKNFTAASVLTASDVNNFLMEQSVMSFASTGARDVSVTAPEDGMVAYIRSNDSSEGLYTYNGTSWRRGPGWNAPWGWMASATQTGALFTTSGTTEATITSTASFNSVANRYYLITVSASVYGSVSGDQFTIRIRNGSLTGTVLLSQTISMWNAVYTAASFSFAVSSLTTAASNGLFLTAQRISGTGTLNSNSTASPALITMSDIGSSGAPV